MADLRACPCGKVPTAICVDGPYPSKYVIAYAGCCSEWHFEFRADYKTGAELRALAEAAWNNMPRGDNEKT